MEQGREDGTKEKKRMKGRKEGNKRWGFVSAVVMNVHYINTMKCCVELLCHFSSMGC